MTKYSFEVEYWIPAVEQGSMPLNFETDSTNATDIINEAYAVARHKLNEYSNGCSYSIDNLTFKEVTA